MVCCGQWVVLQRLPKEELREARLMVKSSLTAFFARDDTSFTTPEKMQAKRRSFEVNFKEKSDDHLRGAKTI